MSTLSNTSELNHPMNTSDITENTGNSPDDKVDAIQKIVVTATPGLTVTASKNQEYSVIHPPIQCKTFKKLLSKRNQLCMYI